LAAFGVVLYHAAPLLLFFQPLAGSFWVGVPLFLMLSIFLLMNSLDSNGNLKHYFSRRIRRIWPIYYGVITVAFLLYHMSVGDLVSFLTFTQYFQGSPAPGGTTVFWTLQLEEWVYLFIPLIHRSRFKLQIAMALILTTFVFWFFSVLVIWEDFHLPNGTLIPSWMAYVFTHQLQDLPPTYFAAYGFGILAYLWREKIPAILRYLLPAVIILNILISFQSPISAYLWVTNDWFYFSSLNNYLIMGLVLPVFASILTHPPRLLWIFAFLGEESYALYAIHAIVIGYLGLLGIPVSLGIAFGIEFVSRPREMLNRLRLSYLSHAYEMRTKFRPSASRLNSNELVTCPLYLEHHDKARNVRFAPHSLIRMLTRTKLDPKRS
jgi:peptidoglycan/LPS O-acetylase OafA/YrhL